MVHLKELTDFLDETLRYSDAINLNREDPWLPNGLQVPGKDEIQRIAFGVSASLDLFEKAHADGCDCVVVHHGINKPAGHYYDPVFLGRLGFLMKHDMSLFGYHYLLDAHPEIGHNVLIAKNLGFKPDVRFEWGWVAVRDSEIRFQDLQKECQTMFSRNTTGYMVKERVKKIAVVSGGAAPQPAKIQDMIDEGIDCYITGETKESTRELMKEAGISFIGGGHYYTEKLGILALQERVDEKLGVETLFIDLENRF